MKIATTRYINGKYFGLILWENGTVPVFYFRPNVNEDSLMVDMMNCFEFDITMISNQTFNAELDNIKLFGSRQENVPLEEPKESSETIIEETLKNVKEYDPWLNE